MQQELVYRGLRTTVGLESGGSRTWSVQLEGAPALWGVAVAAGPGGGSCTAAVWAAGAAVDRWLESNAPSASLMAEGDDQHVAPGRP